MDKHLKVTPQESPRLFLTVHCKDKNKPVYIETHKLKLDWTVKPYDPSSKLAYCVNASACTL